MSKQVRNGMYVLKKIFLILLVLDFAGLLSTGIALFPIFNRLAGYGQLMLGVAGVIAAVTAAVQLFEILAKLFLIRSTSPAFSWSSGRKGYTAAAKLLLLFNLGAVLITLLSLGGEGATLINQGRLYLQILISAAEIITVFCYLRTVKRILLELQDT